MAFDTAKNILHSVKLTRRKKRAARDPRTRNYMKKELHTHGGMEPEYRALLQEASDKKAPSAEKTKSYYRFSTDYPGLVDAQGYRMNSAREEKSPSKLAAALFAVALLLCFSVGYMLTHAAIGIADEPTDIPDFVTQAATEAVSLPEENAVPGSDAADVGLPAAEPLPGISEEATAVDGALVTVPDAAPTDSELVEPLTGDAPVDTPTVPPLQATTTDGWA